MILFSPESAAASPTFFTGTLYKRHLATSFNGLRGSVLLSTRSEIEKVVPSANLTKAVSDLTPESSTDTIDFAESRRITSNSELVTEGMSGMGAALAAAGITELASNTEDARLVSTLRRSKFGLEIECNCVFTDEDFGAIDETVENDETVMPSIEEITAIDSSERTFIVEDGGGTYIT